ncbi:zinc finger protein 91-like isoform X1 [Diabrotica virgifera virgifera]|uniref:C2H2-type domain-containing protein n=1 Tax=Diabrotica virgifera virgifera TaxID=50390 RepID=A0ABM5KW34_DIAVI|nr:zinc finger protein 91-like isoform X1 [Diabrotica virgifera virgifera]XP_050514406.1 zinc finger protein 91-like isoform X1 [Diabrotica virgifera virgifera]
MAQSDTAHDRNLLSATVKAEILNNDDSTLDNNFSGKAIDFQFSIQPKVEQSEIKDEVEELEFVGEVIEFSENELSGLEESQEPNYGTTKESYWCEQCNAESCYKKHDLHADFIRITTKPLNQSNPYECATCSIKLLNPTIALFHLSLHDKDSFRCYKCNCILLEFSDFLEHIEKLHSKDKDYYRCVECNFVTFWHLQYADHNNKFHKPKLFHKCKLCDEFWPSRNHSLHEKMLHIKSKYGRNPYVCKKCEIELVDPDEIYDHLKIHGDIGIFCSFCAFTSENLEDLENHKKDNHAEEVEKQRIIRESCKEYMENDNDIKCDLCNRYWPDKIHSNHERMILVEKQVTEDTPYKCTACNKKTCNLREVYKHVNRYCRYTMKCPFCSKVFRRRQGLDNHVIREHPGKKYVMDNRILKCKLCEYSTVVRKNFHSHVFSHKSKEDRPQYNCNECNFTTYNSSYLKKHRLIKHPVESDTLHTCDKCTYSTYLTSRMTKHLKTHVDNEIFKCDICNGLFGRERSLQRHKARHFQEKKEKKQYVCEICAKVYYFKPSLLQHLYCAHQQGEAKIYMCYSCTYKSSNRTKFIAHTKVHTKQEFLYCANCEYKTVRKLNLIQHMVKHADSSKLQLHKCKVCSFETKRAHTLRNHVKYTHGTL